MAIEHGECDWLDLSPEQKRWNVLVSIVNRDWNSYMLHVCNVVQDVIALTAFVKTVMNVKESIGCGRLSHGHLYRKGSVPY
jgi:hypothetical protein